MDTFHYFKVPQSGIESIRSKLTLKTFDEYANILKDMHNTRFNGSPKDMTPMTRESINIHYYIHIEGDDQQVVPSPNPHLRRNWPHVSTRYLSNIRRKKEKEKKGLGYHQHTWLHTFSYTFRRNRPSGHSNHSYVQWNWPYVETR